MKRILSLCCLAAMLILGMADGRAEGPVAVEVYLIDPCGGCQGAAGTDCKDCKLEIEAHNRYSALLAGELAAGRATLAVYNMRKQPERYDERTARLSALGIERKDGPLPSVFVGDALFKGDGSDDEGILSAMLSGAIPASLPDGIGRDEEAEAHVEGGVLYLYSPACRDCKTASPLIESLAGDRLRRLDIATPEGLEAERAAHGRLNIPEQDRIVPMVILGDTYLAGIEQIESRLPELIQQP